MKTESQRLSQEVDTASSEGVRLVILPSVLFGYIVIKTRFQECVVFNPFSSLNWFSVICNFSFIFVFYSYFQNSQIQMSCFHTWILLICQAIAMMTFCLSLRTTETICILPSFSLVHTCVAAQQGILTLLFHKRRKKKPHNLIQWCTPCFLHLRTAFVSFKDCESDGRK